jgi:hypothetical protein
MLISVPLLLDRGRSVKANISLDAGLLETIDEEAKRRGLTRSAFLSSAAVEKIESDSIKTAPAAPRMHDAAEIMSAITTARLNRELDVREAKRRAALDKTRLPMSGLVPDDQEPEERVRVPPKEGKRRGKHRKHEERRR